MDEYRGLEGYKRMREEVMESLLAEYPELRGKMEVYDLTAQDQKAEQRRVENFLGLSKGSLNQPIQGEARYFPVAGGNPLNKDDLRIVIGNLPPEDNNWDSLKPNDINFLAWHLTHELFHGVDMLKHGIVDRSTALSDIGMSNSVDYKWFESLADAGRLSLFKRNFGDKPDSEKNLKNFIIGNNFDHGLNGKLASESDAGTVLSDQLALSESPKYDNGELLARISAQTPIERKANSYRLEGWQRSFDQITTARENWMMLATENSSVQVASTILMSDLAKKAQAEASQQLSVHADYLKQVYKVSPEVAVEALFLSNGKPRMIEGSQEETNTSIRKTITAAQEKFIGTLREKQDIYPGAARIISSYEARLDPQKQLPIENEKTPLATELTARAYSLFDKTKSPDDLKAAQYYSQVEDVWMPQNIRETLNNALQSNPELRETLKHTEQIHNPTPPSSYRRNEP